MRIGLHQSKMRHHSSEQFIIEEEGRLISAATGLVSPIVRRGFEAWASARKDAALPLAEHLRAEALVAVLPYVYLVDVIGEPGDALDFRYRLVGTDVVSHTEADNTGHLLSEVAEQGSQAILIRLYELATEAAAPAVQRIAFRNRTGSRHWYETIVMPMAVQPGGPVVRLLGVAEHFSQSI